MPLSTTEIKNIINDIERRFPVESWTMEGLHVWFLARLHLYFRLFYHERDRGNTTFVQQSFLTKAKRVLQIAQDRPIRWRSMLADRRHTVIRSAPSDVVMLSYSLHRVRIRDTWYDKFCDPFADAFDTLGLTSLLLEMNPRGDYRVPRYRASQYIQPAIDRALLLGHVFDQTHRSDNELAAFLDIETHLTNKGLAFAMPSLSLLLKMVRTIHRLTPYFDMILTRTRPSLVLIAEYYNYIAGALILACRRHGIPTVDIQHGVQGEEHVAYGSWLRHPPGGYELFPDMFWCWSPHEASAIERWTSMTQDRPKTFIGGNLWSSLWRDQDHALVRHYDALLKTSMAPGDSATTVLLTPGMLSDLTDQVLDAMRTTPANTVWWLRLHPCLANRRSEAKELLASHGIKNYEIDRSTDLPLEPLLRHADVNITAFSSTVIDAELLGIPSILTDSSGVGLYPEQVKSGAALPAFTTADLLQAIATQRMRKRSMSAITGAAPTINASAMVQRLLETIDRAGTPRKKDHS